MIAIQVEGRSQICGEPRNTGEIAAIEALNVKVDPRCVDDLVARFPESE
jgi:hypothetical protein